VLDSASRTRLAEQARDWLAAGTDPDEVLGRLRRAGAEKLDSVVVWREVTGASLGAAKLLIHHSPVWADRRRLDEEFEDRFWRMAFIATLLEGGEIHEPAEDAAEFRDRRQRAAAQLRDIAAGLPDDALTVYHEALAGSRFGRAFATLVAEGRRHDMPDPFWRALAAVAETVCLNELLDEDPEAEYADDDVRAAQEVRRRAGMID
jgi:hypothetical protein